MNVDLHSHSHYSDGDLSPTELVKVAADISLTHLALTDHDTLDGLAEAQIAAEEHPDLTIINGIELSCTWDNQLIHIVGLNVDPDNTVLKKGVALNKQRRIDRAEAMFEDLEQHDIYVRDLVTQALAGRGVPTRPHFADALISKGLAKDKKQAFKRYLVRGKPGYIPMRWPPVTEIAHWIQSAGGTAALAHPNRYKFTRSKLSRLLAEMVEAGVHAMEVSTSTTDKHQSQQLAQLANQFGLFASIGSDFHSHDQPWARLGSAQPLCSTVTPVWTRF